MGGGNRIFVSGRSTEEVRRSVHHSLHFGEMNCLSFDLMHIFDFQRSFTRFVISYALLFCRLISRS